ncbi:C40 family peptidase [Desulfotomaculum sp. OF05-3]|uniref:C40 family peptidase n=1 Tax=Desulfotomaculum sp. OF05-3 TaxID=2305243 RepID=UPI001FA8C1EC|nr:C40 family peptidase [Desulfotomaculum sp. OF05-3]
MSDREMIEETKKDVPDQMEPVIPEIPAEKSEKEPEVEAAESASTEPEVEAAESASTEPEVEAVESASTEPEVEAAEAASTEPEVEAAEADITEPEAKAAEADSSESETEGQRSRSAGRRSGNRREKQQPVRPKKEHQASQRENILRLREIKKKKAAMPYMKILAAGGAAVAVVAVVAVAGTVIGNHRDAFSRGMKVETAAASLETTEAASESTGERNIVLETTLSAEEIASKEYEKTVQSIVDSYANLGIAEVSGYLNVRKTPESFGEVIGKLPKGGACEILDTSTDGWYKISSGGVTGYVSSQYVYTGDEAKKLAAENVAERAVIDADKLNVRSEPKADANVVEQVFKNERYDIRGQQDGWIQISSGYISADYVTVKYALDEAIKQDMRQTVLSLYDNLGVSNVSNYLNVRDNPDEKKGKIIAKLPSNAGCDILDTSMSGWYKIRSGNITGYVKSEYILTGQQAKDKALQVAKLMAISNTDGVNVRTEPNTNSSIYTQISNSERFLVADQQDGWVKIEIDDQDAYLSSDYVDVKYGLEEAIKYTPVVEVADTSSKNDSKNSSKNNSGKKNSANDGAAGSKSGSVSSKRAQIANYAVQFVGNRYVYGGTSLTNGTDCSGFTMSVMAKFGVSLPHNSGAQSGSGKSITSSQMRPGDLVFYSGSGGINHVALYIGNGQVCHASNARSGIKISTWNYRTPAKIVNVLGD